MKLFCCVMVGGLLCFGCGKKAQTPKNGGIVSTNAAAQAGQQPLEGVVEPTLTAALKSFMQEKGRLPESFFELKNSKFDSIPRAPEGCAYAIDPVTVEVKIIKQ